MWIVIIGVLAGLGFLTLVFWIISKILNSKSEKEKIRNQSLMTILVLAMVTFSTIIDCNHTTYDYILIIVSGIWLTI